MTRYLIEGEEVSKRIFNDSLEVNLNDQYTEDDFEDLISEIYPEAVLEITFKAGKILREYDYVTFRCAYVNELSRRLAEIQDDLENYGEVEVNGYSFEIIESEDEEN